MEINSKQITLLDCATGSNLIKAGMPAGVCVEKWCIENPNVIITLQKEAVNSGSNIVYTPTFGANRVKLASFGFAQNVEEYNTKLAKLTIEAVGGNALVAGNISSLGVFIKPFGDDDFEKLYSVYSEQITVLKNAGVDLIVAETLMTLAEARAAVLAARDAGMPVFVTITTEHNGKTLSGTSLLPAVITLQEMGASAVGLNCSYGPDKMAEQIAEAVPYAKIPLIAKPNAGEPGKPLPPEEFAAEIMKAVTAGARIIGGCCGTTPEYIKEISNLSKKLVIPPLPRPESVIAAASESQVFFLDDENIVLSEPLKCGINLADELIDIESELVNVALINITCPEDIEYFIESAYMSCLPVAIKTESEILLEKALSVYQGRALVDRQCGISDSELERISKKYGALLY